MARDMKPRCRAGAEALGGCHGTHAGCSQAARGGCWPHGRDAARRVHLTPCIAMTDSAQWGGWDRTGKGAMGQAGDCVPDPSPQVGRCCPQTSSLYTHGHLQPLVYIMGKVGASSLCGYPIPHVTMTLLPSTPRTPVMSCSTTAATSHHGPQSPPAPLRHFLTSCSKGLTAPQMHPKVVTIW